MPDQDALLLTGGPVEIAAAGKPPTVTILAYSGNLMNVPGWGPIVIDLAGLDLSASQVGILADHDALLKGIVGHGQTLGCMSGIVGDFGFRIGEKRESA